MERLTKRTSGGDYCPTKGTNKHQRIQRLAAYEDILFAPDGTQRITLKRLSELVTAEQDGRCVVLPCNVGSDLWSIERARSKCTAHGEEYSEYSCQGCEESCDSVITQRIRRVKEASLMTIASFMQSMCFGKTVFLTREQAEAALKEVDCERD